MFATKCSFCQFENVPGARFCAECGSPLHLRVCARCGKVSDVTSSQCEHCHADFPRIDLAPAKAEVKAPPPPPAASKPAPPRPPAIQPEAIPTARSAHQIGEPSSNRAWPLIVVALVAGGLPLLWFNRASLPEPKTFTPPPVITPTIQLPPGTAPAPQPVAPTSSTGAQLPAAEPTAAESPASQPVTPAAKAVAPAKKSAERAPVKEKSTSSKPQCTEALAAIGMCKDTGKSK